jgi:SpoVK/Ycf46/Vps4 family AAA+-type ATPase
MNILISLYNGELGIRTGNANVFILAATHSPWELDAAIRRR